MHGDDAGSSGPYYPRHLIIRSVASSGTRNIEHPPLRVPQSDPSSRRQLAPINISVSMLVFLTPTRQPFSPDGPVQRPPHPQTALLGGRGPPEAQTQGTILWGAQSGAGTRQAGPARSTGCLGSPGVPAPVRAHVPALPRVRYRFCTRQVAIPLSFKHIWTMATNTDGNIRRLAKRSERRRLRDRSEGRTIEARHSPSWMACCPASCVQGRDVRCDRLRHWVCFQGKNRATRRWQVPANATLGALRPTADGVQRGNQCPLFLSALGARRAGNYRATPWY